MDFPMCLLRGLWMRSPLLNNMIFKKLSQRLCFMYKLIDNNTQILPTNQRSCPYTTRSTHSKQLENISCHSSQYLNSYFPQTITDWNNLPASIVSCHNIVSFKYQLYKFMFQLYVLLFLRVYIKYQLLMCYFVHPCINAK